MLGDCYGQVTKISLINMLLEVLMLNSRPRMLMTSKDLNRDTLSGISSGSTRALLHVCKVVSNLKPTKF